MFLKDWYGIIGNDGLERGRGWGAETGALILGVGETGPDLGDANDKGEEGYIQEMTEGRNCIRWI